MATQANVTLRFLMSGANSVMGIMDRISGKKRDLERDVEIPIKADDSDAQGKFNRVKAELTELNHRTAEPKIKPNDVAGMAKLSAFKYELRKLNDYVARPTISERGLARTEMRVLRLKAMLEGLDKSKSGVGFSPFTGISGVGAGASAVAIQAMTSPVGAAATAAAIPFAGTALGGGILGGAGAGLAGLGVAGALGAGNKSSTGQLAQAQGALHTAQLRVIADQEKLNKLQTSGKATASQLAAAHATLASAQTSVIGAQDRLNKVKEGGIKKDNAATESLQNLEGKIRESMATIGQSFVPVLSTIFDTFNRTIGRLTPVFAAAEKKISGPFKQVGVILANSFTSPAVVRSIQTLASSFAQFLSVFAPQIPGIINSFANGMTGIATAFTDHPGMIQGMANVTDFLLKLPGYTLSAIGALVRVTSWLTSGFPHEVSRGLDAAREFFIGFGHGVESVWNSIWGAITGTVSSVLSWLGAHWKTITAILLGPIVIVPGLIVKYWSDIKAPFVAGYNFIVGIYHSIMNWITTNFDKWWAANGEALIIIWRNVWAQTVIIFHRFFDPVIIAVKVALAIIRSAFSVTWTEIRGITSAGWGLVRGLFVGGMQAIKLVWQVGWTAIGAVARIMWANIQAFVRIGWSVIVLIFKSSIGILVASWRIFWSIISNVAKVVWTVTKNAIKGIWDIIVGIFTVFINLLTGRWRAAGNAMHNMAVQVWNLTKANLQAIWNAIKNIGIAIWNALRAYLVGLWNNTKGAAITIWNAVKGAMVTIWRTLVSTGKSIWNEFFGWLRSGWHNVVNSASTIWNGIKNAVMGPVRWVAHNVLAPLFRGIDSITGFVLHTQPLATAARTLAGMASGGKINAGTTETADDVLIRVSKNETVLSAQNSRIMAPVLGQIGVPGYSNQGDRGYDVFPGFASGGQVESQMLRFMLSKRGQAYSQARRWGEPPWDCSSLVWQAAHNAGVPIPQSQAIAASEANWFGSYPGTFTYGNRMMAQTGDIIASTGASPGGSRYGGVGHIGMAANSSTMISALGSRYGVTLSRIPSDFVQGFRLGGPGGKNILSSIGSFFSGVFRSLTDIFGGIGKFAGAAINMAKGNLGGAISSMLGLLPGGAGGATGEFGHLLTAIPGRLIGDFVHFMVDKIKNFASAQQGGGVPGGPPAKGPLQNYAKKLLAQYGWANQWGSFNDIVMRESGWRVNATNASSGAYGIPQALPGSKMASAGSDWRTSGYTQLRWMMAYIKSRWGDPNRADAHERAAHWYASGTSGAAKGWAMVGEEGPELVHFRGGEQVLPNDALGFMTGYASGTNPRVIAAEIARLRAAIAKLEYEMKHARTAVQRNVYAADIRYDQARIYALQHPAVRARGIPKGEINTGVSLMLSYMHGDQLSAAKILSLQTSYLRAISKYYTGPALQRREALVTRQTKAMETARDKLSAIQSHFSAATSYASSVTSSLSGYAGLSNVDLNSGSGIVGGVNARLGRLKSFAAMLTKLRSRGVSTNVISQIISMGPDTGYDYAAALVGASGQVISAVNQSQVQAGQVAAGVGRAAAMAVYGVDITKGITSQERTLRALMVRLGRTLGREAIAWFHVPRGKVPRGYASGTLNANRGWAWVGENGPEMMYFHGGEAVVPPGRARRGGGTVIIENLNVNFKGQPLHTKADIGRTVKEAIAYTERRGN